MCDYSLKAARSRPAKAGDKLTTHNFGYGTSGFRPTHEAPTTGPLSTTAVCVLPGTRLKFEQCIKERAPDGTERTTRFTEALFHQIDKEHEARHHDVLDLPDGQQLYLTNLVEEQHAEVVALPAAPTTPEEAEEQRRAEFV